MHRIGQEICSQFQCCGYAVIEAHHDLEVIVNFLVDDVADVGKYGSELRSGEHPAELIQKVHTPVVQHSAAFTDEDMPVVHVSVKAVEHALYAVDVAQSAGIIDRLCSAEIRIETALMMDRELYTVLLDGRFHLIEFCQTHGDGFLTDDVLLRIGCLDHKVFVELVVRSDQHYIHFRIRHEFLIAGVSLETFCHIFKLFGINV